MKTYIPAAQFKVSELIKTLFNKNLIKAFFDFQYNL